MNSSFYETTIVCPVCPRKSLQVVGKDLTDLMDLFDQLGKMLVASGENSPPLIDPDCKNSVIGMCN